MTAAPMRIGDVARLAGTTPRTIRYYEEIGLLPDAPARPSGQHRLYGFSPIEDKYLAERLTVIEPDNDG